MNAHRNCIAISSKIMTSLLQGKSIFANEVDRQFFTKASRTKIFNYFLAVQWTYLFLHYEVDIPPREVTFLVS